MTSITIFATCKPFTGESEVSQRNAIASWTKLPNTEVILLGDDYGTSEIAREFGLDHIQAVPLSEHGTPLVNGLFSLAEQRSVSPLMCYVNSDMLLMPDFVEAAERIGARRFLMVGRSIGVKVESTVDFDDRDSVTNLTNLAANNGEMRDGLDYFLFTRGLYDHIPDMIIGRGYWDHWLVYYPRTRNARVYDATDVTTVIHQDHGWSHVDGGEDWIWKGPEIQRNKALIGEYVSTFGNADVTWRLSRKRSVPVVNRRRLRRAVELAGRRHSILKPGAALILSAMKQTRAISRN